MTRLLLTLLLAFVSLHSDSAEERVRVEKARYLFEMEGRSRAALHLLGQVSSEASEKVQLEARLLEAKIHDILKNDSRAAKAYQDVLASRNVDVSTRNWIAERLQGLNPQPIDFVLANLAVDSEIKRIFGNRRASYLELEDGSLLALEEKKAGISLRPVLKLGKRKILSLEGRRLVLFNRADISLQFLVLSPRMGLKTVRMDGAYIWHYSDGRGKLVVATSTSVTMFQGTTRAWSVRENLSKCSPLQEPGKRDELILLCDDNTVQVISLQKGTFSGRIPLLEEAVRLFGSSEGFLVQTREYMQKISPLKSITPTWKNNFQFILDAAQLGDNLGVLTGNGDLWILDPATGRYLGKFRSGPGKIVDLGERIGIYTREGALRVHDFSGKLLWSYQAGSPFRSKPYLESERILLPLEGKRLVVLNRLYHGIQPTHLREMIQRATVLSPQKDWDSLSPLLDTIFSKEFGNSLAWQKRAEHLATSKAPPQAALEAWHKAAMGRKSDGVLPDNILDPYSQIVGARWIRYINSPGQFFPRLFAYRDKFYYLDNTSRRISAVDSRTGTDLWTRFTGREYLAQATDLLENRMLTAEDYSLQLVDLTKEGQQIASVELPGKICRAVFTKKAILVSTWTGYVLALDRETLRPVWTRKIASSGVFFADGFSQGKSYAVITTDGTLHLMNLSDGTDLLPPKETGQKVSEFPADTRCLYVVGNTKMLSCRSREDLQTSWTLEFPEQIFSVASDGKGLVVVGLANQELLGLDATSGEELWRFQGADSFFIRPSVSVHGIFIDQGNSLVRLSRETGELVEQIPFADNVGPPVLIRNQLLVTTQSGLMFSFRVN